MFDNYAQVEQFVSAGIKSIKLLVVGDIMIDKYYYCDVSRISPEAPVPVARVTREKSTLGGAANVAHNLARSGCQTKLCGVSGQDENRRALLAMLEELSVDYAGIVVDNRPTTAKARVLGGHQQMLRLDFEETLELSAAAECQLREYMQQVIAQCDGVILSDYGKGVLTPSLCQFIISQSSALNKPVFVDPKGANWQKYCGAYCATPNVKELGEVVGYHVVNSDDAIATYGATIREQYNLCKLLVTRSEKGMTLVAEDSCDTVPVRAQEVFDVSGAGDTVISIFAAAICGGLSSHDATQLANYAAGVVVGKLGTYAVSNEELVAVVLGNLKFEIRNIL